MKRLFPAIALLFVVAFSSFTTAAPESSKTFGALFKLVGGVWSGTNAAYISTNCTGGSVVCAIDVLNGSSSTAQQYIAENPITFTDGQPVTVEDFDDETAGDQSMIVYPKP